jgi:hypothetical protein
MPRKKKAEVKMQAMCFACAGSRGRGYARGEAMRRRKMSWARKERQRGRVVSSQPVPGQVLCQMSAVCSP